MEHPPGYVSLPVFGTSLELFRLDGNYTPHDQLTHKVHLHTSVGLNAVTHRLLPQVRSASGADRHSIEIAYR